MASKSLGFKCALITGAAGGIGRAIAEHFLSQGKKIVICGRTESKLQAASRESLQNCPYYVLDTGKTDMIPDFISRVTGDHPDIDCLINNAGVQRPLDVNDQDVDDFLAKADNEVSVNIQGPLHLTMRLLPHLKSKPHAVIMNISSVLGYNPVSVINPIYNGTKAWVHFWSMNLRTQLDNSGTNIKVIEIAPPTVSTELHREREDPNDNSKDKNPTALGVEEFMKDVIAGWEDGSNTIGAGPSKDVIHKWYETFGDDYANATSGRK